MLRRRADGADKSIGLGLRAGRQDEPYADDKNSTCHSRALAPVGRQRWAMIDRENFGTIRG